MNTCTASALIALFSMGISVPAMAQTDHSGHGAKPAVAAAAPAAKVPLTDGLVKKIDKSSQKVTLSHGPLPNGMPAMTMAFRLKDAAWLDQMKVGQTIRFVTEELKGEMTVVRFEPAK